MSTQQALHLLETVNAIPVDVHPVDARVGGAPAFPPERGPSQRRRHGSKGAAFTILELLIAMAIFSMLGTMAVYFMQNSLDIFYTGTRESAQLDRIDTVLPQIVEDLQGVYVGDDWRKPYVPSAEALEAMGGAAPPPPSPVSVRFRAGFVYLQAPRLSSANGEGGASRELACPFMAFVVADASEWSNKLKRRAGDTPAEGAVPLTPSSENPDARYLATGGLMEVLWIAVPREDDPGILDLYRGWRSPIGDPEKSLLDPRNYSSRDKILAACRVREKGLLHFGLTFRRVFATSWDAGGALGDSSETLPYVGPAWDSTRAFSLAKEDANWRAPLQVHPQSLMDPSDDIFPAFLRIELVLSTRGKYSDARGDLDLVEHINESDMRARISEPDVLLSSGLGATRFLKIDDEWMQYDLAGVDSLAREVRLRRGVRNTKASSHASGAKIRLGDPVRTELKLPVYRDRYAVRGTK